MPDIKEVFITTRAASETDPGAGEIGFYFIEAGVLRMCNESGKPTGSHHKLWPDDDPHRIAKKFTRDAWRQRTKELGGFHRTIVYPPWKPA
jgi:hypothetical protein